MAYRGFVEEIPANLKRTVPGTFDFGGRSTRTEFLVFAFVPQLLISLGLIAFDLFGPGLDFEAEDAIENGARLLLMVPFFALFVRRLHDQDRTGWWALLLGAVFILVILSDNGSPRIGAIAKFETPAWLDLAGVAGIIAIWVFSLLPPTPEANRYGRNPRLDEVEVEVIA